MFHCDTPGLLPIAQALEAQLKTVQPVTETETIAIHQALGRIVATSINSPIPVPLDDNSAMDGFAFKFPENSADGNDDSPSFELTLIGESFAGHPFSGSITDGQCVQIMTGAVIPQGADTVVMQENITRIDEDKIRIDHMPTAQQNVRFRGEDISKGQEVVATGARLTAAHLSLLASVGVAEIDVFRKPRIAVIATGDELKAPGQPVNTGEIYESNRIGLIAMLQKLNVDIVDMGTLPDDKEIIKAAFEKADQECDWVISSGGVSVGEADYVKEVLAELGQIDFWKVAIKPGKPYAFGKLPNSLFSGLPGNPVSSFVTFMQLVVPVLRKLAGEQHKAPVYLNAVAIQAISKRPGRADYQRGKFFVDNHGHIQVSPQTKQGSNMMSSFIDANCFIVLEQDRGSVQQGEKVQILPFDAILQ
ncbi:molybdopterin molybdotransferase MoeA [Paraneptunicella aestuarii]|uniref:molybdopterin molybdotransferase MoeA n=1 Tax=Paraneptunicella aestuarii TaxID=2831148 RepID=UPI001E379680|nr:gephyrin-like molybdotransferase Glp [Paraneptunicella aestuarii]UAA40541.1 molybdopterin molybdotransferase MoeA [Paraneptunicella aestuarii]